jgi:hypothetical protein
MTHDDDRPGPLREEDRRLVDTIAQGLRPEPMDPARRAAFRRALDRRLERRMRTRRGVALAALASGAAAWLVWLAKPTGSPEPRTATPQSAAAPAQPSMLLAFVAPDEYSDERVEPDAYLPREYAALAHLLELDDAGR